MNRHKKPQDFPKMKNCKAQKFYVLGLASLVWLVSFCQAQPVSIIQFTATNFVVNKAAGRVIVTVQRTPGSATNYTTDIIYQTWDGSARSGIDYVSTSGTLSWTFYELCAKSFSVPIISSGVGATNKSFFVGLSTGPT